MNPPTQRQKKVLNYIEQNQGCRYVEIKRGLNKVEVSSELGELLNKGLIRKEKTNGKTLYYPTD